MRYFLIFLCFYGSVHAQTSTSHYVTAKDGTKLAVDVHLPAMEEGQRFPALVILTRYWRGALDKKTDEPKPLSGIDLFFFENGYAIIKVDARGSGASFGTRPGEYTPVEVMDAKDVLDWVVAQAWSDGAVGSYGTSYEGTTAELLCATKHPAVKAVIPGWSDFDIYRSPVRPYGMLAGGFIKKWSFYVRLLDRNTAWLLGESIRPVEKELLKAALKEHKDNPRVYKVTEEGEYRNSRIGEFSYEDCSPVHWQKEIEESGVPMLALTSWMDAGTSEGTLQRLQHFSNPQKVVMMATCHGGWAHASPFLVSDSLLYPNPRWEDQRQLRLDFFDHYLKGIDKGVEDWPLIRYYNLGEEAFRESDVWPPKGTVETPFYFTADGGLGRELPSDEQGTDDYRVDFSTSTGEKNRWTTQMGGAVLNLDHRNEMDEKMLVYTSSPMSEDLQISGTPVVNLQLSTTHEDGALFVYLEDVDENGVSRYITEGGLRLIHRKTSEDSYNLHSFNEEDAQSMEPGKITAVQFRLWPISVRIQKGHQLRIAIAGADKDTFDRVPKSGKPVYTIYRDRNHPSMISLPLVNE